MTTRPDVIEMFDHLCGPHKLTEAYERQMDHANGSQTKYDDLHVTLVPALMHQLRESIDRSTGTGNGTSLKSKPAARLDAIDTYTQIDKAAAKWVRKLGEDDVGDAIACIRKLAGLRVSADAAARTSIDRDVRRWWTWARVATGWDSPALTPYNTCLACGALGTLKVRPAEEIAVCTGCQETWDPDTIGMLARHIRAENGDAGE